MFLYRGLCSFERGALLKEVISAIQQMLYNTKMIKVTPLPVTGNSSKFQVTTKRGGFNIALSYTLRTKIWKLADAEAELSAAKELTEAIVSRQDPALPFKALYIFGEHNSEPTLTEAIHYIRKYGAKE
jgi:hypothetical protein